MQEPNAIRLLIASPDAKLIRRFSSLSTQLPFPTVVAEAHNGGEAINLYLKNRPDVTFLDMRMAPASRRTVIQAIRAKMPNARIVLIDSTPKGSSRKELLQNEVNASLRRDVSLRELAICIRAVNEGSNYGRSSSELSESARKTGLTKRELEVLNFVAADMSNREIGEVLSITEGTVKIHIHHILSKLGVNSRTGAIAKSLKDQLL